MDNHTFSLLFSPHLVMQKLLGIVIPTYNRAACLELLLRTLSAELFELEDLVDVVVSDNKSTDETKDVMRRWESRIPGPTWIHADTNLGAEENFCRGIERLSTKYFWIIGDDDLPKAGVIKKLVELLKRDAPDMVYMQSEWLTPLTGPEQGEQVTDFRIEMMNRQQFAKKVHVWFTFISSTIVSSEMLMRQERPIELRKYIGTQLVQLGWTLPALKYGSRFIFIYDKCMLATKDNSGGYALLTVFGSNFSRIAKDVFSGQPRIADILVRANILHYLPGRIWGARFLPSGKFAEEKPWASLKHELRAESLFWALIFPLVKFPKFLAMPFYQGWRVYSRVIRDIERFNISRL